ncbi:hypothetical protein [Actinosynnema sp. NPDC020468]|uniref:Agd3-related carbohydrate-binding protein n=1 Tax=Actinosynnema sp. NPDC020468 TaxID=3154488 RepID=UPI0033F5F61D
MTRRRTGPWPRVPLLVLVGFALAAMTLASPREPVRTDGEEGVTAVPLPLAVKSHVPVRPAEPPGGQARRGDLVALRQLVIATGPEDFGLAAWKAVLDATGSPYDVLFAGAERLVPDRLVQPDGTGRYNAVLLTNGALLREDAGGAYTPALDPGQWNVLWDYEREFRVRQAALNTYPGETPEDQCLRPRGEGPVEADPVPLSLTAAGREVFDYLVPEAKIPLTHTYVYRADPVPGCATPLLSTEDGTVAVTSTTPDGRERLALTFAIGPDSVPTLLLGHGLLRWATRGVMLGEQRHWFSVDVDDWFNSTLRQHPDGTRDLYRLTGRDAVSVSEQQRALREKHPVAAGFTLNLPLNGSRLKPDAPATCDDPKALDPLSSCSKAKVGEFRWINHTATHPQMNDTSYEVSREEIRRNLDVAAAAGLPVPQTVLKTPEYSGLGVYNPDPKSLEAPTDFGLAGSNKALLDAAHDEGVQYLQGNMSFASHRPSCFNCGTFHPLRPELLVVPDWPTNVAFEATDPAEQIALYNVEYGKAGRAPDHADHDLTYEEFVAEEAEVAVRHLMSGSVYAHTLHQGNLREYAPGRCLGFDWIAATVAKYAAYYSVPLKNPDWVSLAEYVRARTAHFAQLTAHRDAVWNRATGAITYSPSGSGSLFITGVQLRPATEEDRDSADEGEVYGSDPVARLGLDAGGTVTVMASPRP